MGGFVAFCVAGDSSVRSRAKPAVTVGRSGSGGEAKRPGPLLRNWPFAFHKSGSFPRVEKEAAAILTGRAKKMSVDGK
jgi:hypothetical protein